MISTGVDIVKVSRIENIVDKRRETFYRKVFTKNEINYIKKRKHNIKTISGLFAAKESVSKAIGSGIGKIGWKDIEVRHNSKGRPIVNLSSSGWSKIEDVRINTFDLSISHEKEYAIAFVVGYYKQNKI